MKYSFTSVVLASLILMGAGCSQQTAQPSSQEPQEPAAPAVTQELPPVAESETPAAAPSESAPTQAESPAMTTTPTAAPAQTPAPAPAPKEVSFDIKALQWEFQPSIIRVHQGDHVTLRLTSTDVTHGFSLPDYGIKEDMPPNQTVTVTFTADKKGTFGFRCSVFCGADHGAMKGSLIVE